MGFNFRTYTGFNFFQRSQLNEDFLHRQIKYLNNRIEADHGKLKILVKPMRGLKSMKTAYATIKGFEVLCMFRKQPFSSWMHGNKTESLFINELFGIYR